MDNHISKKGDLFSIKTGNLYFEVDASFGGHISSFKVDGRELLYFSDVPGDYLVGSTLWPSPQGVWDWPPSAELDREAYKAELKGNTILMTSKKDPASGLVFKKIFAANKKDKSIDITYMIINEGVEAYEVAAWAVTRVPALGSLTFFPKGDTEVWGTNSFENTTEVRDGIVWYQQLRSNPTQEKFFCDGSEGWLAHVNKERFLFVKSFEDVPAAQMAPEEGEIEVYYKNEDELIELENQSAYVKIPPEGSFEYKVRWHAEKLPSSIDVSVGSKELIERVRIIANLLRF